VGVVELLEGNLNSSVSERLTSSKLQGDVVLSKTKPSENRGPNLRFPRVFVRYQSTYEQIASAHNRKLEGSRPGSARVQCLRT
jgi:hypothetical protein